MAFLSLSIMPANSAPSAVRLTDPASHAADAGLPLVGVPGDDLPALGVVLVDAHLCHVVRAADVQRLVDLVLLSTAVRSVIFSITDRRTKDEQRCKTTLVPNYRSGTETLQFLQ